ncbi:MAG: aminopeptidase P family protein [Phycisphaerales bacterium]|nr:aminopeptidase P family protein [Phycisphaerales bacterium]
MRPVSVAIPSEIVRDHVARLGDLMRAADYTAVIVFAPANMLAFVGVPYSASDRLTCAAITREGAVHAICPAFERPGFADVEDWVQIHTWAEDSDAYAALAAALATDGIRRGRLGVDGRIWLEAFERFKSVFPEMQVDSAEHLLRAVRICKSPAEQAILRAAHALGERAFLELATLMRAGISERALHDELTTRCAPLGLVVSPLIQSGPNASAPHHLTDERVLRAGDAIVVDSVTRYRGYFNDLTRTWVLGTPGTQVRSAYRAVRTAQAAAIEAARPGVAAGELDAIARRVITEAGFGPCFVHRLGHGIGLECHEPPYLVAGNGEPLRAGMCMTVEPGIYVPGEFGIRIEDDIIITADGCEVIRGELATDVCPHFDA